MKIQNPFHEGELQVQERVGVLKEGAQNGVVIQDSIMKGALRYISQQPIAVLGSLDHEENVWASVFVGRPGFMRADDERTISFDLSTLTHNPYDPFWKNIKQNPQVGMLAIELASRRRLRINGRITRESDKKLTLNVEESYPNCPKYIQRRHITTPQQEENSIPRSSENGNLLGLPQQSIINKSDTFFVASVHPERGVDASHRGGNPGFVKILNDQTLRIPDYPGNSMFNTLGNFTSDPRAGLMFVDFESNRTLQLTGRAEILYDMEGGEQETGGTNRYWDFHIDRWIENSPSSQMTWEFLDYSPHNLPLTNGSQ